MSKIKAIIMDVDGTLVNDSKQLTEQTRQALLKAQREGVTLMIASGRPTRSLMKLAKELKMPENHGLLISYNGSRVTDCETGEVLFDQPLSVENVKAVLAHMKKFEVNPMIDKDEYMYVNNVYAYKVEQESRMGDFLLCEKKDLEAFADFSVNKILTSGNEEYLKANYKEMMKPFEDKLNCVFTAPWYFEFTEKGIDKANAISAVLRRLNLTADEVMAFGDAENDATMIDFAGTGVAMENAVDSLKAAADFITKSNNNDGIAYALYYFGVIAQRN